MNTHIKPKTVSGFTLTETSIAAGIVSFSLLPLVGLMGLISTGEKRVRDESSAHVFVETISQTLQPDTPSTKQFRWHFPGDTKSIDIPYPVAGSNTVTRFAGDSSGRIVRSINPVEYETGLQNAPLNESFIIESTIRELSSGMSNSIGAPAGLELEISVESPVTVAAPARDKSIYRTRLR